MNSLCTSLNALRYTNSDFFFKTAAMWIQCPRNVESWCSADNNRRPSTTHLATHVLHGARDPPALSPDPRPQKQVRPPSTPDVEQAPRGRTRHRNGPSGEHPQLGTHRSSSPPVCRTHLSQPTQTHRGGATRDPHRLVRALSPDVGTRAES